LEDGYEAFSMRRLADRCGYTAPTIYHYFGDKPGLLDALLEERFAELLRRIRKVPTAPDPADTMRALAHAFVDFGMRNPTFYQLLLMPRPGDATPPRSAEEARAVFEDPLLELHASGRLYTTDVEAAKQTVWVLLHGLVHLPQCRPDEDWSPDLVEVALDSLLRALRRRGRQVALLEPLRDLDRRADLERWLARRDAAAGRWHALRQRLLELFAELRRPLPLDGPARPLPAYARVAPSRGPPA
ncbi:MAG: TetR/AcrR family transcriptional regulator, partial [Thermoanaerobaculia bacterium]|nr:TetR/AcrR family transcriptional regulator [Thermoanaerobaculia bacterium]